ncbi:hypothetical protein Pst134EA_000480 [Puccinia striiformis f. sp. tritici]|nr:hypothetical protein Pst134EA_000480 [Puccinia striiformis f. sp. tritici]KAH9466625.1 hypothetical protein Pst134EB_001673 [Puccinia striiformis f. sp. tritici]KAH9473407.1 hypothetical protein Pst134EA_000480 [Puccinia striiformis f. sp. tritici]
MRVFTSSLIIIPFVCFLASHQPVHGRLRPRMIAGTTATHLTEVGSEIKAGESLVNARELVASGANSLPHGPQETWSLNSQQGRLPPLPSRTSPEPPHTSPFKAPSGGALGSKETASSKLAGFSEIKPKLAKYSRKVKEGFYDVFTWVQYQVYKIRTRSLRPPTKKELEKFNEVKEKISTDLALGAFYLNNQEKLDVESIAKRLDEKLSPPVNRYKPAEQAKPQASIYKDYVKKLELRQLSAIDLKDFQQKWESIKISTGLTDAEKVAQRQVNDFILETEDSQPAAQLLDYVNHPPKKGNFINGWSERRSDYEVLYHFACERAINSIKPQLLKWQSSSINGISVGDPRRHFPTIFLNDNSKPHIDLKKFVRAQAVQLKMQPALEESGDPILTVEKVLQSSDRGTGWAEELRDYSLVQGFENILERIKSEASQLLLDEIKEPLSRALAGPLEVETPLKLIFASDSKEDVAWRENLFREFHGTLATPSVVFAQLKGLPEDEIRIRSALDSHANFLDSVRAKDRKAIYEASSDRGQLTKQLDEIEARFKKQGHDLMSLQNFRKDAIGTDQVIERPFVLSLHEQGLIDKAILTELNPPGGLSREDFLKALGTQEDFNKRLMEKFKGDLLNALSSSDGKPEETVSRTIRFLVHSHISKLHDEAKSIYLTPALFERPQSLNFDKALEVFQPEAIKKLAKSPQDMEMLAKAYIRTRVTPQSHNIRYKSDMDEFLSQIKIPQTVDHTSPTTNAGIVGLLPDFDERLSAIYLDPLKEGDVRLDGTPYVRLTKESRDQLNSVVNEIYSQRQFLDALARDHQQWNADIQKFEQDHLREIPTILKIMESCLRDAHPSIASILASTQPTFMQRAVSFFLTWMKRFRTYKKLASKRSR